MITGCPVWAIPSGRLLRSQVGEPGARRIFITGLPGSGKSTVARLVADSIERSVHIGGDFFRESIAGGFIPPAVPFTDDSIEQIGLCREAINFWIERMVDEGYTAVVDEAPIPFPPHLENQYRFLLGQDSTVKVALTPAPDEVRKRIERRGAWFDETLLRRFDDICRNHELHDFSGWHTIDNGHRTPEETAELILRLLYELPPDAESGAE